RPGTPRAARNITGTVVSNSSSMIRGLVNATYAATTSRTVGRGVPEATGSVCCSMVDTNTSLVRVGSGGGLGWPGAGGYGCGTRRHAAVQRVRRAETSLEVARRVARTGIRRADDAQCRLRSRGFPQ